MIYRWRCTRAEIICHTKISLKSGMKYAVKKEKKKNVRLLRKRKEKNFEINVRLESMN